MSGSVCSAKPTSMFASLSMFCLVGFLLFVNAIGAASPWPAVTKSSGNLPNIAIALAPAETAMPGLSLALGEMEQSVCQ